MRPEQHTRARSKARRRAFHDEENAATSTQAILARQVDCMHNEIAQSMRPNGVLLHAPVRVCVGCGIAEEGGGPGFVVLTHTPSQMLPRHEVLSRRLGVLIAAREKARLMRREETLREILHAAQGGAVQ